VITVLEYLVIAAVIGLVVFVIAVFVFGRGEQMAALSPRVSPSQLPESAIGGDDVRRVRFGLALRGYRMSDVDWTLDRLADEIDALQHRLSGLTGEPLPSGVPSDRADLFEGEPDPADRPSATGEDVTGWSPQARLAPAMQQGSGPESGPRDEERPGDEA
jgi:DivIVA domain-containing protein